jgi:Putative DNA-binding domain
MIKFNILDAPISDLKTEDLNDLYKTEEGWYAEFKERSIEPAKLAKSISAFANTYGGRLFIGAKETAKGRKLQSFTGSNYEQATQTQTLIREAVRHHISPMPHYDCVIVKCPCSDLSESESTDTWMVIVDVPKGTMTPYIHSSGVIFQRVGDSSSPSPVTDSHTMSQLTKNTSDHQAALVKRAKFLCTFNAEKIPRCDLLAVTRYEAGGPPKKILGFKRFKELASQPIISQGSNLFDSVYPFGSSYIARRTEGNLFGTGMFWEYDFVYGIHRISIPLSTMQWKSGSFTGNSAIPSNKLNAFSNMLQSVAKKDVLAIDLLPLYYFLAVIGWKVQEVSRLEEGEEDPRINAQLVNVHGCVPFLDTKSYIDQIQQDGVPFAFRDPDFIRDFEDIRDWIKIRPRSDLGSPVHCDLSFATTVFINLASSIGMTDLANVGLSEDDEIPAHSDFSELVGNIFSRNFSFQSSVNYFNG